MNRLITTFIFLVCLTFVGYSQRNPLDEIAETYRTEYKVPGLSICVIKLDTILYGVAGVKHKRIKYPVDLNSKFHIGSNTKAITSMIAGFLVEEGKISWDSKLVEVIPELKNKIHHAYEGVTLEHLLSNRGKIQPFEDDSSAEWRNMPQQISNSNTPKLNFAKYALNLPPKESQTKNHSYSNGGFGIAALMLERCSGTTWDQLVEKLNSEADIGLQKGFPSQKSEHGTHGHIKKLFGYKVVSPEKEVNLGNHLSPSGNLSGSIIDISKLIHLHLRGLLGRDNLLRSDTYQKMHFGFEDYALGWYNGTIGETDQKFSYHGGSLGTFSSAIMLSADRKVGIVILINSDGKKTTQLKDKLRTELWTTYGTLD